jgi:hypothetical protein
MGLTTSRLETVGQKVSEQSDVESSELLAWICRCQHPGRLRSTTGVSGEFVGAAHEERAGRQERCAGQDSIDAVVAGKFSYRGCGVARVGLLGRRRWFEAELFEQLIEEPGFEMVGVTLMRLRPVGWVGQL